MKRFMILLLTVVIFCTGMTISAANIQTSDDAYVIDNHLIEQISKNVPNYVTIDQIPEELKEAIVAIEDHRFYNHPGFDIIAVGRAFLKNLKAGEVRQGGSTITQQLAKNLFLSNERTFERKWNELKLAMQIENQYTKDEILEMYLNIIYYGAGAYGIQNASQQYFDKNVSELSLAECAMLAGLPQAPSAYAPSEHFDKAKVRQETVLQVMVEKQYITKQMGEDAKRQIICIK